VADLELKEKGTTMRVLVPLQGSSTEQQLAGLCEEFVGMPQPTVVLVHVLTPTESIHPASGQRADAYLAAVGRAIGANGVEVLHCLRVGDPTEEIVALGRLMEAELIVMHAGPRGARGRRHISEEVLERADRPVITIGDRGVGGGHGIYARIALGAATRHLQTAQPAERAGSV
jgi:nucleotide-binding universal stress UspA family protein